MKAELSPEVRTGLVQPIERYLDVERWDFRLSHHASDPRPEVIYDSPMCRVKFSLDIDLREGDRILVRYARSHVSNDVDLIKEWEGERCFAWHRVSHETFIGFLEGFSPREAARRYRDRERWSAYEAFDKTDLADLLKGKPAWTIAFENFVWDLYGDRLFSIFDVQHPEKWEALREFLREFYGFVPEHPTNKVRTDTWGIPAWRVC